ncbi:putative small lipoprotein YifL [Ochrobactrum daejeonense]|uniref:Putative small lipoprotein YifL n=1 Tax=Brucella daejeonensis TaxID=659015 RepID=A0A7W9AUD7_9HYPH|nr:lipoprotein [Brucella daejeonensis]MBB5700597.1 putative small lipoprotein YifL [Brucella daejeonensis]
MTGRSAISSVLLIAALAAMLSACGRKGPLEPPPAAVVTDEQGHTREKPKEDKPFILDKLL